MFKDVGQTIHRGQFQNLRPAGLYYDLDDDLSDDDLDNAIGDAECAADDIAVHLGELRGLLEPVEVN